VAAGAALGCALGATWFAAMVAAGRSGLYSALAAWPPAASLLAAKDTWGCPEPLALEQGLDYIGAAAGQGGAGAARSAKDE
jgi:hypothetical protein